MAPQGARTDTAGRRRVTMTDIAREAGCSQATVSFVLNRAPGIKISQQMRDRVVEVARTLGYSAANFADLEPEPAGDGLKLVCYKPLFSGPAVERVEELQFQRPPAEVELAADDA